jgi:hypothetical protein
MANKIGCRKTAAGAFLSAAVVFIKRSSLVAFAIFSLLAPTAPAADPSAVDYTQRNDQFAPAASIAPTVSSPAPNGTLPRQPRTFPVREKTPAAVNGVGAPISITEAQEKKTIVPASRRPDATAPALSDFNGRRAAISTARDSQPTAIAAKYQASLAAARAASVAALPAGSADATATVNRFVFRKNAAGAAAVAAPPAVSAGQGAVRN